MIPKFHHLLWTTRTPFAAKYQPWRDSWITHNPSWVQILWTLDDLPYDWFPPICVEMLKHPDLHWVLKSDIARELIVWLHGGVYSDTDVECCKSMDRFLSDKAFCGHSITPGIAENAIFGAEAGNNVLLSIAIAQAEKISKNMTDANSNIVDYGVNLARKMLLQFPKVYPTEYFTPFGADFRHKLAGKLLDKSQFPESYCIHHWTGGDSDGWWGVLQAGKPKPPLADPNRSFMFYGKNALKVIP